MIAPTAIVMVLCGLLGGRPAAGGPPVAPLPAATLRARSLYGQGVAAYQARRFPQAVQKLEQALELDPAHGPSAALLALCSVEMGDLPAAAENLTRALNLRPDDRDLLFLLIRTHAQLGEWGAASDLLDAAEARLGRTAEVLQQRAEILLGEELWLQAEAVLVELKRLRPGDAAARLCLLDLYERLGARSRALAEARELRQLFPLDVNIQMRLAQALLQAGHEDQAVSELEELSRRQPAHVGARAALVQLYSGPVPNPERLLLHEARLKELRHPRR